MVRIYTSRYGNKDLMKETEAAIVGITVGKPRFQLSFMLQGHLSLLAPYGLFGKSLSHEEFSSQYREKLDRLGVANIRQELSKYASYEKVILLCYEDVRKQGQFCHRTVFAEWWEEKTGEKVTELEGPPWKPGNVKSADPVEQSQQCDMFTQ